VLPGVLVTTALLILAAADLAKHLLKPARRWGKVWKGPR
jgi:hypothetical protein